MERKWELYKKVGSWKLHRRFRTKKLATDRTLIMKKEGHVTKVIKKEVLVNG